MPGLPSFSENRKKGRMRRGVYLLPSLFTVGTLVCGYYAVLQTLRGAGLIGTHLDPHLAFDNAARAIGWAILFDGLDGRIARLTNSTSDFGREFDSLADVITFGVAPALLAYAWGVRALNGAVDPQIFHRLLQVGWVITFGYVICGAARLARFNIDAGKPSADRRYFVGLPIPGAAGVIAATVHLIKDPLEVWYFSVVWLLVLGALAFLMVSRVRYPSFKSIDLRRRRPYAIIILIGLIVYGIWAFSEQVLMILAAVFVLSGPVARLISRIHPHPPAPKEVHAS